VARIRGAKHNAKQNKRFRKSLGATRAPQRGGLGEAGEESPELERKPFANAAPALEPRTNGGGAESNGHPSQRYEALWIPDNKATTCLMEGCGTKFSVLKRKHHCRQCGWLICGRCVGRAPVKIKKYESCKVCPACFYEVKATCEFPRSHKQARARIGCLYPPGVHKATHTQSHHVKAAFLPHVLTA